MSSIGYEFIKKTLGLNIFKMARPAEIKPVTRVEPMEGVLSVPKNVAPASADILDHLLFALKHEGTNLQVISAAVRHITAERLIQELGKTPTGAYIRLACYLWENLTSQKLDVSPGGGQMISLFDEFEYVTLPGPKDMRWRVHFNGLGNFDFCPTVRRTAAIIDGLGENILGQVKDFISNLDPDLIERAVSWAYLSETDSSFAIERETPSSSKAEAFVQLMHQAHERELLSEEYLSGLQASTISNPLDQAHEFRHAQNWLSRGLRGSAGVTYVPPAPDLMRQVMGGIIRFANQSPKTIDPLVAASLISFGFVFAHPFMDGNGRLSRFLFHHTLCNMGALDNGMLLPVSIAMKRNEREYLDALQSFSKQARALWDVTWIDEGNYLFDFKGHESIYRYWDATNCVEFSLKMAKEALEIDLKEEAKLLHRYDTIVKKIDDEFDVRNSDLSFLVAHCLQNNGHISNNRRKKYADRVQEEVFAAIEQETTNLLNPRSTRKP